MAAGYGDGIGITKEDAANFTPATLWTSSLKSMWRSCTSFNELKYFTGVTEIYRDYFGENNTGS
jgi:hypothetical protein